MTATIGLSEAQIAERKLGIGGSDAAAALGLNPNKSRFRLFLEKTGQIEPEDIGDKLHVKLGNLLEPVIAKLYQEAHPEFKIIKPTKARVSKVHPFMRCNLDYWSPKEKAVIECKSAGFWAHKNDMWGEFETDEVPMRYLVQVFHEMIVTESKLGYLPLLADNNRFGRYVIPWSDELAKMIIDGERQFWDHVESGEPPPVRDADDTLLKYPVANGNPIVATDEIAESMGNLLEIERQMKDLKEQHGKIKTLVQDFMGEYDVLLFGESERIATWKQGRTTSLDTERMQKEIPKIYNQYARRGTTRTFRPTRGEIGN